MIKQVIRGSLVVAAIAVGGLALSEAPQADASYFAVGTIRNYTPQSMRGKWYAYVNGHFSVTHINPYSVTQTYQGQHYTMFRSRWSGYRKLAVARVYGTKMYTFNALANTVLTRIEAGG